MRSVTGTKPLQVQSLKAPLMTRVKLGKALISEAALIHSDTGNANSGERTTRLGSRVLRLERRLCSQLLTKRLWGWNGSQLPPHSQSQIVRSWPSAGDQLSDVDRPWLP